MSYFILSYNMKNINLNEIVQTRDSLILLFLFILFALSLFIYYLYTSKYKNFIYAVNKRLHAEVLKKTQELKIQSDKLVIENKAKDKKADELIIANTELDRYIHILSENTIASNSNLKGIIIFASKALCEISGYSQEELIGQPHSILKSNDTPKGVFTDMWKTITSGETWTGELLNTKKDGGNYWVRISIIPDYDDNGEIIGYSSIRTDITKEKEMIHKDKQLIQQSRLAQMGEMISMIAHQWRQPLGAISTASINVKIKSQLEIFDLSKEEEAKEYEVLVNSSLDKINGFVENLTNTIDDFRNFYKQDKNEVSIRLDTVVISSLGIIDGLLKGSGIKLITKYNSQEKIEVFDSELMQVIINILKNAHDNLVEKEIKDPFIEIITDDRSILICDNGGGIPENIIESIFDPYFTTKGELNGTGLGLYMSKMIVEDHHKGKLSVNNTNDGVCFRIKLTK